MYTDILSNQPSEVAKRKPILTSAKQKGKQIMGTLVQSFTTSPLHGSELGTHKKGISSPGIENVSFTTLEFQKEFGNKLISIKDDPKFF